MASIHLKVGSGKLAPKGKSMVAHAMFMKGAHFLAASVLLKQRGGFHDVVLHLLGQSLEVLQKGLLLARDYDEYRPMLQRPLGHDLVLGAEALQKAYRLRPMNTKLKAELLCLSSLYRKHLLRYGGIHDLFGHDSKAIETDLVFQRAVALTLMGRKVFRSR